jgi:hypothetical protein
MFETTNQPDVCCKLIPTVAGGFPLTVYPCSGWFNPHGKSLFSHGNMGVFLCDVSEIPCFFSDRKVVRQTLPLLGIKNTINYGSAINPTVNLVNKTNLANENPCKSHENPTVLGEISIFLWFSYGFPMFRFRKRSPVSRPGTCPMVGKPPERPSSPTELVV